MKWIKSTAILVVFLANLGILASDGFTILPALAAVLAGAVLVWDAVDAIKKRHGDAV